MIDGRRRGFLGILSQSGTMSKDKPPRVLVVSVAIIPHVFNSLMISSDSRRSGRGNSQIISGDILRISLSKQGKQPALTKSAPIFEADFTKVQRRYSVPIVLSIYVGLLRRQRGFDW